MESTDNADLLDQFINVTGVDRGRAKFYLESAAWNLQIALGSFYEDDVDEFTATSVADKSTAAPTSSADVQTEPTNSASDLTSQKKPPSRFATLSGVHNDESSDEEEGQAFYAGGSERSGQQILGPGKKGKDDLVADMFKAAKEQGAEEVDGNPTEIRTKLTPFKGAGYRLGADENHSEVIPDENARSGAKLPTRNVVLKMWKNGFSVDDGPLREYADPANKEFLESIRQGEIPSELLHEARHREVNLDMEDHRHTEYETPNIPIKAFSGKGHMLGSPAPKMYSDLKGASTSQDCQQNEQDANRDLNIDEAQPVTNIQIRLADGSRVVAKMNHTNTVGDIRRFITIARPHYAAAIFSLFTTFPNRELADDAATLKDANLLNAVVMQRIQ